MTDEEKKAIESFKEENNNDLSRFDDFNSYTQFKIKRDKLIIELIEKQQKEIEELKKDKLDLINKNHVVHIKDVEKELREMRKAIDTKNAEIECLNVIHESYKEMVEENNFISKDKIKAKIEELKNYKTVLTEPERQILRFNTEKFEYGIKLLQSLLEKE